MKQTCIFCININMEDKVYFNSSPLSVLVLKNIQYIPTNVKVQIDDCYFECVGSIITFINKDNKTFVSINYNNVYYLFIPYFELSELILYSKQLYKLLKKYNPDLDIACYNDGIKYRISIRKDVIKPIFKGNKWLIRVNLNGNIGSFKYGEYSKFFPIVVLDNYIYFDLPFHDCMGLPIFTIVANIHKIISESPAKIFITRSIERDIIAKNLQTIKMMYKCDESISEKAKNTILKLFDVLSDNNTSLIRPTIAEVVNVLGSLE